MNVDRHAPLVARMEIVIQAPLEVVWNLLTDLQAWPEWQGNIASVIMEGDLAPGTIFRWKASGIKIVSTLQEVEPMRRISWTGTSPGMRAIHIWDFESYDGGLRVVTEESLSGWFASLLKLFDHRFLEKSLEESLQTLKRAAEKL
jgi:uncharacterized membrane protein